jgi:hypothetical protein
MPTRYDLGTCTLTLNQYVFESGTLSSAFCRALGKGGFTKTRTRWTPALGNELVYRVQDTRHRKTLGKDNFAEWPTLGKGLSAAVPKLTAVSLCRGPRVGTRQSGFFAECQVFGTRQRTLYRVSSVDTRQSIFLFFLVYPPNFLWYVTTLCRPTCIIYGQL